jgi:hypothetical protein
MIIDAVSRYWRRSSPSAADRRRIRTEIDELTSVKRLSDDLPSLYGKSGSAHIVGDGSAALRIELHVQFTHHGSDQRRPPEETDAELRDGGRAFNTVTHEMRTNRDLAVGGRVPLGLPQSWLRVVTINWSTRFSHNQLRRTAAVTIGTQYDYIERNRVPNHSADFYLSWRVVVTPASGPVAGELPAAADDVEGDTSFTEAHTSPIPSAVWFEEHLATPRADWQTITDNTEVPRLAVLDLFHNPGLAERRLRENLVVDGRRILDDLSPDSQRSLIRMLNNDNSRGQWEKLRSNGVVSEPLYNADGTQIGLVRVRLRPRPRLQISESDKTPLETYHRAMSGMAGTTSLQNAAEASFGVSATIIREPIEAGPQSATALSRR